MQDSVNHSDILVYYSITIYTLITSAILTSQVSYETLCFAVIIKFAYDQAGPKYIRFGLNLVSIVSSFGIMVHFMKIFFAHQLYDLYLWWIPFANIGTIILANYLDMDFDNWIHDVEKIEKFKYDLRTA